MEHLLVSRSAMQGVKPLAMCRGMVVDSCLKPKVAGKLLHLLPYQHPARMERLLLYPKMVSKASANSSWIPQNARLKQALKSSNYTAHMAICCMSSCRPSQTSAPMNTAVAWKIVAD